MKYLITLILFLFKICFCGNADSLLTFADYLFDRGEYTLALKEYERCESVQNTDLCSIQYKKAKCLLKQGRYEKSSLLFDDVISNCEEQGLQIRAHIDYVRNCLLNNKIHLARFELGQAENYPDAGPFEEELAFLELVTHARFHETDSVSAKSSLFHNSPRYKEKAEKLKTVSLQYPEKKFKSPNIAHFLSTLVPGSGACYLGDKKKAATAFVVVSSMTAAAAWSGYKAFTGTPDQKSIAKMDLFVFGLFIWYRYFDGNRKTDFYDAILHNEKIRTDYAKEINRIGLGH